METNIKQFEARYLELMDELQELEDEEALFWDFKEYPHQPFYRTKDVIHAYKSFPEKWGDLAEKFEEFKREVEVALGDEHDFFDEVYYKTKEVGQKAGDGDDEFKD